MARVSRFVARVTIATAVLAATGCKFSQSRTHSTPSTQTGLSEADRAARGQMADLLVAAQSSASVEDFSVKFKGLNLAALGGESGDATPVKEDLLKQVTMKIASAKALVSEGKEREGWAQLKAIAMSDVFGPAEAANSFSNVVKLTPGEPGANPLTAIGGSPLFDGYPAAMTPKQSLTVIEGMLRSPANDEAILVGQFFQKHGDPFFGKFLQLLGRKSIGARFQDIYDRTVFNDLGGLAPEYVDKVLAANFPAEKFNIGAKEKLGAGTIAETYKIEITERATGKKSIVAAKIFRENVEQDMKEGVARVRALFNAGVDANLQAARNSKTEPPPSEELQQFFRNMANDLFSAQERLNLGEVDVGIEKKNLKLAERFTTEHSQAVRLLELGGMRSDANLPMVAMDFAEGIPFSKVLTLIREKKLTKEQLAAVARAFADVEMGWVRGAASGDLMHSDMHGGNFAVDLKNGKIITYDWGAASAFSDQEFHRTLNFSAALLVGDEKALIEGLGGKSISAAHQEQIRKIFAEVNKKGEWLKIPENEGLARTALRFTELTEKLTAIPSFRIPQGIMELQLASGKLLATHSALELALAEADMGVKVADYWPKNAQWDIGWALARGRLGTVLSVGLDVGFRQSLQGFKAFVRTGIHDPAKKQINELSQKLPEGTGKAALLATAGTVIVGGVAYLFWPRETVEAAQAR